MLSYFLTSYVTLAFASGGACVPDKKPAVENESSDFALTVIYADPGKVRSLESVKTVGSPTTTGTTQTFIIRK